MVIDDNPISTFLIEEGIPKDNEVITFNDPYKIMNSIRLINPNMVLLDIVMPNMCGFDLLKKIKDYDKNIKVIIVSSLSNKESIDKAYNLGCDYYIKKPFNFEEFKKFMKKRSQPIN